MALTREKKEQVVANVKELLSNSKITVIAKYQGTTVKDMQALRRQAKNNGTKIVVAKNRLIIKALKSVDKFSDINTDVLNGMLTYAFNSEDEVAPAQNIAEFAKTQPTLEFIGAITYDGKWLNAEEVKVLANLPSKPQLIASVVALLHSPIQSVVSASTGGLAKIVSSLETRTI